MHSRYERALGVASGIFFLCFVPLAILAVELRSVFIMGLASWPLVLIPGLLGERGFYALAKETSLSRPKTRWLYEAMCWLIRFALVMMTLCLLAYVFLRAGE